jgi:hypothetical protein
MLSFYTNFERHLVARVVSGIEQKNSIPHVFDSLIKRKNQHRHLIKYRRYSSSLTYQW